MVMARAHIQTTQSSTDLAQTGPYKPTRMEKFIVQGLAKGKTVSGLAKDLEAKVGRREASGWRYQIVRCIAASPWVQAQIHGLALAEAHGAAPAAVVGLGRRAMRGRPDAAKPILEMTGIHNPRVKHDHTGEIKVTLDLPRPERVETVDATFED